MSVGLLHVLAFVSALACALVAGVFFAFSTFVMRALGRLPAPQGIAAMQSINVAVIHPGFLGLFLGAAAASLALGALGLLRGQRPETPWLLAGALAYLLGAFAVTLAFNVPRNDALAALDPGTPEAARYWATYLSSWTAWNSVRAVAALLAAAAFLRALLT